MIISPSEAALCIAALDTAANALDDGRIQDVRLPLLSVLQFLRDALDSDMGVTSSMLDDWASDMG